MTKYKKCFYLLRPPLIVKNNNCTFVTLNLLLKLFVFEDQISMKWKLNIAKLRQFYKIKISISYRSKLDQKCMKVSSNMKKNQEYSKLKR